MAVNKDTTRTENINKIGENNTFEVSPTDIQEVNSTMINDMVVDGRSLGSETDVFIKRDDGANNDGILEFRTLKAGTNVSLSLDGEAILITGDDAPNQTQNLQSVFNEDSVADSPQDIEMSRGIHKLAVNNINGFVLTSDAGPSGQMSWVANPAGIVFSSNNTIGGSSFSTDYTSFEYTGSSFGGVSMSKKVTISDGEELSTNDGSGSIVTAKTSSSTFKANGVANDEFYDFEVKPLNMKLVSGGNSVSALGVSLYGNATTQRFKIGKDNAPVDDATATLDISGDLRVREVPIVTDSSNTLIIDGTGKVSQRNDADKYVDSSKGLDNIIVVKQSNVAETLGGVIDSTKEYFIDGVIDLGTTQITVPSTGITLRGYSFDLSGLTSSEDNYNMFISASIGGDGNGSGNVLGFDYFVSVTGVGSKVYELYDDTGFNAFEFQRINYNNCTSLGDIYSYRQGLETGTGRFGGSPSLTLHGVWLGGFRITTSIVRGLSGTMTEPLFKEGVLFQMNSRFLTDINVDLPTLAPLLDFQPTNFPNASTLQLSRCEITRDGSYVSSDTNITPSVSQADLCSYFKGNNGIRNTFVGGVISVISEAVTTVSLSSTYYDLQGVFLGTGLQHFSASSDGKLTHLGTTPTEYEVSSSLVLESTANNDLTVRFRKWDDSEGVFVDLDYTEQTRQVNNLQGGRDVANFTLLVGSLLDKNDYLQLQVKNNNGGNDVTAEAGCFYRVQER